MNPMQPAVADSSRNRAIRIVEPVRQLADRDHPMLLARQLSQELMLRR